jgi:hypothetical protein
VRIHLYTIGALMLALHCAGCVFPWTAAYIERPCRGANVYLVRGLCGYWPGAHWLSKRLERCGIDNRVIFCKESAGVACALEQDVGCEGNDEPIVIIGYSLGANEAIKMCQRLDNAGVTVASLILIDCPYRDSIPPNVLRCLNVYRSRPATDWIPMFRGLPICAESCETDLQNVDTRFEDIGCAPWTISHFTICADHAVHAVVAQEVKIATEEWYADDVEVDEVACEAMFEDLEG